MCQLVETSPFVEVARRPTQALFRESERQSWSDETLAFLQMVFGIVFVDAGKKIVIFSIIGFNLQSEVARIAECGANDIAGILARFAVEREHHFCMVGMRVAHAILIFDNQLTWFQRLLGQSSLVCP